MPTGVFIAVVRYEGSVWQWRIQISVKGDYPLDTTRGVLGFVDWGGGDEARRAPATKRFYHI